uniref:Uncharacterized protein n=1 Tax=Oryza meridionalis TaxID=40149 RepID=A0A0E0BZC3_9ORYZ
MPPAPLPQKEEITLKELPPRSCAGTGLPLICKLGRNHRLRMRSLTNSWDELVGPLRHQLVNSTKRPEPMSHVVPDLEKVAMKMLVARAVRCLLMTMALTTPCLDMYQPSGRRQYHSADFTTASTLKPQKSPKRKQLRHPQWTSAKPPKGHFLHMASTNSNSLEENTTRHRCQASPHPNSEQLRLHPSASHRRHKRPQPRCTAAKTPVGAAGGCHRADKGLATASVAAPAPPAAHPRVVGSLHAAGRSSTCHTGLPLPAASPRC